MRARLILLSSSLLLAGLFAGCGGADDASSGGTSLGSRAPLENAPGTPSDDVPEEARVAPDSVSKEERVLFESLNNARERYGLEPLERSADLNAVARAHSREMASTGVVAHDSKTTGSPADRVRAAKIPFSRTTENVAMASTAASAHEGLMESPGHKANILDPDVLEVGVGGAEGRISGGPIMYFTQVFIARIEKVSPKRVAETLYDAVRKVRKKKGASRVSRDKSLEKAAEKALSTCFDGGGLGSGSVDAGRFAGIAAAGLLGGSVEDLADALTSDGTVTKNGYDSIGLAVRQGAHPQMGDGTICVRVFLGKRR